MFDNLQKYDGKLNMEQLGKFDFKLKVIPYGLRKYMSAIINN